MRPLIKTILWIGAALTLSHCGEAFRATEFSARSQQLGNNSSQTQNHFTQDGFRLNTPSWQQDQTQQVQDLDLEILRRYSQHLQGRESQTQSLSQEIQAFDFVIAPETSTQVQIRARVHFSCSNQVEFQGSATLQQLLSSHGAELSASAANMNLRAHCLDQSCRQMVASISRQGEQGLATVLVGLAANSQEGTSIGYMSRQVPHQPYFAAYHSGAHFQQVNNCQVQQQNNNSSQDPVNRLFGFIQETATDFIVDQATNFLQTLFN